MKKIIIGACVLLLSASCSKSQPVLNNNTTANVQVSPAPSLTPTVTPTGHTPRYSYSYNGVTISIGIDVVNHAVPVFITKDNNKTILIKDVAAFDGLPEITLTE